MTKQLVNQQSNSPAQLRSAGTASASPPQFGLTAQPLQMADNPTAAPKIDHAAVAKEVHDAGADLAKVKVALKKLNCNDPDIKEFKKAYLSAYNTPVETALKALFKGDDLTSVAALLSHSGDTTNWGQTHEASNKRSETISNAPEAYKAWNGTFGWTSRFQLYFNHDQNELVVRLRLYSDADAKTKAAWKSAVEGKWGNKFDLEVEKDGSTKTYDISMLVDWVDEGKEHYKITANKPGDKAGGREGIGGTNSMTGWGTGDTTDITHEVGHMLGAAEDYFTTDGVDHTAGGKKKGFRDKGGGIMNNPSEDPFARHYDSIRKEAAKALGIDESKCKVK
jgi:hypothetical protein